MTKRSAARSTSSRRVNQDIPLEGLNWFFDHAETISDRTIDRIAALGGGIAVQHRMAYQGEYFVERYGPAAAEATPPIAACSRRACRSAPAPMRRASRPTIRGSRWPGWSPARRSAACALSAANCLDRETALRMWTEQYLVLERRRQEGTDQAGPARRPGGPVRTIISPCPRTPSRTSPSVLTMRRRQDRLRRRRVQDLAPPLPPAMPDWSPVRSFGGYQAACAKQHRTANMPSRLSPAAAPTPALHGHAHARAWAASVPVRTTRLSGARSAAPAGRSEHSAERRP